MAKVTRTPDELAAAVQSDRPGSYSLIVTPWEYSAIIEHRASLYSHADTWAVPMRQALAGRFAEFGWHNDQPPDIKVIVDYRLRPESGSSSTPTIQRPHGQL